MFRAVPGRSTFQRRKRNIPIRGVLSRTILRRDQVEAATGLSRSTLYARIRAGTFPAPVALGNRAVGWDSAAIEHWIAERLQAGPAKRQARHRPRQGEE